MPWPTNDLYQNALQNPQVCFRITELKSAVLSQMSKAMPIPKLISGNLACVAFVEKPVRCVLRFFTTEQAERKDRYLAISDFLKKNPSPHFASFDYISDGIQISGNWYPMLRMDLVEGTLLRRQITQLVERGDVASKKKLAELAERLEALFPTLEKVGMAHGDLHDENMFVAPDSTLRLIDYDGMFVPALQGKRSLELGRPDYQHPRRADTDYDATIDRYSSLLMSVALRALAEKPELWKRYDNGQNLLFTKADLLAPDKANVIRDLRALTDTRTRELLSDLIDWSRRSSHLPAPSLKIGDPLAVALQEFQKLFKAQKWRSALDTWRVYQLESYPPAAPEKANISQIERLVKYETGRLGFVRALSRGDEREALYYWHSHDLEKDPESTGYRDQVALLRRLAEVSEKVRRQEIVSKYVMLLHVEGVPPSLLVKTWQDLNLDTYPEAATYLPTYKKALRESGQGGKP